MNEYRISRYEIWRMEKMLSHTPSYDLMLINKVGSLYNNGYHK